MPYITQADVTGKIPAPHLNDALDDDQDGRPDAGLLDQIIATESRNVDAHVAGLYDTPFADPAPAVISAATLVFVLYALYQRRPVGDKNPFSFQYEEWRTRLTKIGNRELPLDASLSVDAGLAAGTGTQPQVPGRVVNVDADPIP